MITYTVLEWGFPFYLIVIEVIVRGILHHDATDFIGPAIATTGLSFLIALTRPKDKTSALDASTAELVKAAGGRIVSAKDAVLIPIVWILILVGFIVWFAACESSASKPSAGLWNVPAHIWIGFINYFTAAVCSAIKANL